MPSTAPRQPRTTLDQQLSPDAGGGGIDDAGTPDEPRRLVDAAALSASATPPPAGTTLASSLPTIGALIAIDVLVGTWAYFNAPGFLPSLSLANVLVVSVGTVTGLLPKKDREKLSETLEHAIGRTLASDVTRRVLVVVLLLLLMLSAVSATLLIQSDGNVATTVHVVGGSESRAGVGSGENDTLAVTRAHPIATSRHFVMRWGKPVWGHTRTHVTKRDGLLYPWKPQRWVYPDDFDEMVTLYVLPTTSTDGALDLGKPRFVAKDADSVELVSVLLRPQGLRVRYAPHERPDVDASQSNNVKDTSALALAWTRAYTALDNRDSPTIAGRIKQWMQADTVQPRRPLHLQEKIVYEIHLKDGTRRGPFEVVLTSNPFHLLVDSSKVDKPEAPAPR